MPVTLEDLRKVPYLKVDAIADRTVNLMPLWDGGRWHNWFPTEVGLLSVPIVDVAGTYVAKEPVASDDMIVPFVELMWQRASWPEVCPLISAVSADFQNLGTSVEKFDQFFVHRETIGLSVTDFVKTELEYIFVLSRSIFDLLQEAVANIWGTRIMLLDERSEAKRRERNLPRTFRGMVLKNGNARTQGDLVEDYAFPPALAAAYETAAPFFIEVRRVRDAIVHRGRDVEAFYSTDQGFCISKGLRGFFKMERPIPEDPHNENIISLLPLLAHVVVGTIEACNQVVLAFGRQIALPEEIAPGYRVFVRGSNNAALSWMQSVRDGGSAWWSERVRRQGSGRPRR